MIKARRLGHVTFETPDLEKAIEHYTQVSGLVVAAREQTRAFLATKLGQLAVQLELGTSARCTRLSLEVAPDENFSAMRRDLAGEGVKSDLRGDDAPGLAKTLAFHDPKGTVI